MTRNRETKIYLIIFITIAGALLVMVAVPSLAEPALADLPPRPTSTPTLTPEPIAQPAPATGRLELGLTFPQTLSYPWQDLWTVVQWKDEKGIWRDVEGWQGTLDQVEDGVGVKTWWVGEKHLEKGPFRWKIYRTKGGWLLATSEEFNLPAAVNQATTVELSLAQ
jgi:hypothetical protein